ncbi:MAG: Ig-like domain repeat protein [Acidobacteria bacterium]|nr:Ig-like domain repeat protein [Acidobacteriota bacterium]
MTASRSDHTATRLGDRVLISGGHDVNGVPLASTEIYDPTSGRFSAGPFMGAARAGQTATPLADGKILIAGGDATGSAEIYNPATNTFNPVAATMSVARFKHSATLMQDGRVLLVGGQDAGGSELRSGETFDGQNFSPVGNQLVDAHVRAVLRVLPDGKVQIIGGGDSAHHVIEIYDPVAGIFGAHAHNITPAGDDHAELIAEIMSSPSRAALLSGGQTITELPSLNKALVAGGVDSNGNPSNAATLYNSSSASVTTDLLDYAPGTPVVMTGRGWQAFEMVILTLHEDPHTHTENVFSVQADANGNFTFNQYAPEAHDNGVAYILGAKGQSSGWTAQTTFTDASGDIAKIGFNTIDQVSSFTVGVSNTGGSNSRLRVQSQKSNGAAADVSCGDSITVRITSSSSAGRFDSSNSGSFTSTSIDLTIASGSQNTPDFFYRDTTATAPGSVTLTATVLNVSVATRPTTGSCKSEPAPTIAVGATATISKVVNKANSTTALTSSLNPSISGDSVTFTATVAHATAGGVGAPTGTVTFKDGATTLGTGNLSLVSGQYQATFSTSSLSIGGHSITAVYGGDSNFNTSTSAAVTQTVNKYPTTTTLSGSPNPSTVGQSVTFTIMVTDTAPNGTTDKTGTVTLRDGGTDCSSGTVLGTDTLNASNKIAHVSTSVLTAGSHTIRACYAGDANYASSSGTTTQTVNATAPTTLTVSAASGTYGGNATLTATLTKTSDNSPVSGKTISFKLNGVSVATTATTNASGQASLSASLSGINAGTYNAGVNSGVTANFAGDSGFDASTGSNTLTVNQVIRMSATARPSRQRA